jgi:hypothetical protein
MLIFLQIQLIASVVLEKLRVQTCGACGDHTLAILHLQHNEAKSPRVLSTMVSATETIFGKLPS